MHISFRPELLFNLGPIPITNSFLTSIIAALLLCISAIIVGKNFKRLPSGLQHLFEMAYESLENLAVDSLGQDGKKFTPFVTALFLFIITNNWLGVLPGVGSIGIYRPVNASAALSAPKLASATTLVQGEGVQVPAAESQEMEFVPLFRGGNADLNTTAALALIAMAVIHISGIRSGGLVHHLMHFRNPLEIISEFGKTIAYSFRLFGNVFAGEVLLMAMGSLIAIITNNFSNPLLAIPGGLIAVPFYFLELLVGFIQAFVFALLTISFLSLFYVPAGASPSHGH